MADTKISALAELAASSIANGDWVPIVDVSDTSMAASGTNKKVNAAELYGVKGTWLPVITSSGTNPTVTYTVQAGKYTRFANVIMFSFYIQIATISGGSGNLRISLPAVSAFDSLADTARCTVNMQGVDLPGTPAGLDFQVAAGQSYGSINASQDNAAQQLVTIAGLSAGDIIAISGFYFV